MPNSFWGSIDELVSAYSARKLIYGSDKLRPFLPSLKNASRHRGRFPRRHLELPTSGEGCYGRPTSSSVATPRVEPRVSGNPYGEIRSPSIVLGALTKPQIAYTTISDRSMIRTVIFDEPVGSEDIPHLDSTGLFQMRMESAVHILSGTSPTGIPILISWKKKSSGWCSSTQTIKFQWIERRKWSNSGAVCLVVRRTSNDDSDNTFEKVGFARLRAQNLIASKL
ncbi:uncharacterized protein PgNI_00037 [Pyricularia grisea]|uniref:Uncharacterized protein n=1 Tax=Pyricularia grisea TaxID=148305 RepID=A0A6P8BJJ1_PYRGI|nr:uncharacterized protein PgNI_00037 [Pyricularia grisea]TLD16849.1 hypothetical protein PgNI_00037 [Pyricularia grisea]